MTQAVISSQESFQRQNDSKNGHRNKHQDYSKLKKHHLLVMDDEIQLRELAREFLPNWVIGKKLPLMGVRFWKSIKRLKVKGSHIVPLSWTSQSLAV